MSERRNLPVVGRIEVVFCIEVAVGSVAYSWGGETAEGEAAPVVRYPAAGNRTGGAGNVV